MSNCVITQEVFVERCFTMTQDTIDSFILRQMEKDVSDNKVRKLKAATKMLYGFLPFLKGLEEQG